MFRAYNINNNTLSIRNMILLFLTIVMWFWAVITLGQISIPSSISNARQTIAHITITETGINTAPLIDMSSTGIFIDDAILSEETNFSWKVLGIDDYGNVIYVLSESLVVSWVSAWGGGSGYWTGNGSHIYNINTGNVWIWINTGMSGKLHIKSTNQTELYLQETNPSNAANINLQNPTRTRAIWAFWRPDIFYIWEAGGTIDFVILPTWEIGIGTQTPKANLQVSWTFIAWHSSNTITWNMSSIAWWATNTLSWINSFIGWWDLNNLIGKRAVIAGGNGNNILSDWWFIGWWSSNTVNWWVYSTIWWGISNTITWTKNTIVGWENNTITWTNNFIWWGYFNTIDTSNQSAIVWGQNNSIKTSTELSTIAGGKSNKIYTSESSFIGWWENNRITGSNHSVIPWWHNNLIDSSEYSFAWGFRAQLKGTPNTFIRNSATTQYQASKPGTFIINVPRPTWDDTYGGVGINTNNPRWDLHVAGQGIVVFEPQTNKGISCNTTWSVYYSTGYSQLCFCDGSNRKTVADPTIGCP